MSEVVTIVDLLDDSPDDVVLVDVQNTTVAEFIWSEIKKMIYKLNEKFKYENKLKSVNKVFNSLIMPAYDQLDKNYKTSKSFEKVLTNTLQLLKNDPKHKFTHIKHLYETLKLHKVKKKASFVTLTVNLDDIKSKGNTKRKCDGNDNIVKKRRVDTIKSDEDLSIISKDNKDNDVILLDGPTELDGEKENHCETSVPENTNQVKNALNTVPMPDVICDIDKDASSQDNVVENEDSLLIPRKVEALINNDLEHMDVDQKNEIARIKKKIAHYKERIASLEKQEVVDDSLTSPYIMSDKYKAKIVELYKGLCKITGTDSVKRHEIRLTVNNGCPSGPVRRLEQFLNDRIESDGLPPFPDFNDVVNCVTISNQMDNLGWNQSQIMREATSLFTQCGRALQRRRQNREWRHLMDTLKEEQLEVDDPAENDPELKARLQQNRRIAIKKENDILERFTKMQYQPRLKLVNSKLNEASPTGSSASSNETNIEQLNKSNDNNVKEKSVEDNDNNVNHDCVIIKSEKVEDVIQLLEDFGENFTSMVKEIEESSSPSLTIVISSDSSSEED